MSEFKIAATIPAVQYGNLMPEFTVEADSWADAQKILVPQITEFWNSVCQEGSELKVRNAQVGSTDYGKSMTCTFTGEQLLLDSSHVYRDADGNIYESGSVFAEKFGYPFDKQKILPMYASKFGVDPKQVDEFWSLKGDNSRSFGNVLHGSLEVYGKFKELANKLSTEQKVVDLGINPTLLPVVEAFFTEDRLKEEALYEVFVVDKQGKRCGQIDRLVKTGDKSVIIEDYKTNGELEKQGSPKFLKAPFDKDGQALLNQPLSIYTLQLNFYRSIMETLGYTVEAMRIHHYDKEWQVVDVPKVQLP